jgi:hypothetical protein
MSRRRHAIVRVLEFERLLRNLARRLDQEAPGVAASILEGLDEMLTVNRLHEVLGSVSDKRSPEDRKLLDFQATEALCGFHHSSGRPGQRHRSISPSLHVATDAAHGPHHILD